MSSAHPLAQDAAHPPGSIGPRRPKVMKFGGTSVGTPDRLLRVADIIAAAHQQGPIVVVVSAMQDGTDLLFQAADCAATGDRAAADQFVDRLADMATLNGLLALREVGQVHREHAGGPDLTSLVREHFQELRQLLYGVSLLHECTPQTRDLVLSFGERISAQVLAVLLQARGVPALYVDARSWTVTDDRFGAAVVDPASTRERLAAVRPAWTGRVPVVTGFLGRTRDGRTTTLGRNGSDYTATMLARWLEAEEVVIWTDIAGVMTADPGIVADAYPLAHLSYMEALELVDFGATMFHPYTMIPLIESGIPLQIRNTLRPEDPGTRIDATGAADRTAATSVTSREHLALLGVQVRRMARQAQIASRVLRALDEAGVTVWVATQAAHGQAVAVVIPEAEISRAEAVITGELEPELRRAEVEAPTVRRPVTLLSLVAEAMGQAPNVAGRFFGALGGVGAKVWAIAQGASARSIACVVDADDTEIAVRTVHAALNLAREELNLLVLGKGTVGGELLEQIRTQQDRLEREHDVLVRVVGIADSRGAILDPRGLSLERWREHLAAAPPAEPGAELASLLEALRHLPVPVLVDCSGANGMEVLYTDAFRRGIHVVTANKKPLTLPMSARTQLLAEARTNHRAFRYETTVGASLPVIDTLKNLVRTGDRVRRIEGAFSGTLGYLTGEVMRGVPLSEATRRARELGYTEPRPQEDLSGVDVARKALILARELGLSLDLEDVEVEPLVAMGEQPALTGDAFLARLHAHDADLARTVAELQHSGKVLRYLARIDPGAPAGSPTVRVGPLGVPLDHPAARLRGAEALVAITSERYAEFPLIVQGAGAGGPVTAAGVLADVLAIAHALRGR